MKKIVITEQDANVRLDRVLKRELPNIALTRIFRYLRKGNIKVNRKKKHENYRLQIGDEVTIFINLNNIEDIKKDNVRTVSTQSTFFKTNFNLIYEDDQLLICNKPSGLVVHPGTGHSKNDTLIDLAIAYMGKKGSKHTPTLVHRIDRDTSGLIIIAKNRIALRELNRQLRDNEFKKEYVALVHGNLKRKKGKIDLELIKTSNENRGMKMSVGKGGVKSSTSYQVTKEGKKFSQLSIDLHTGKTHQIRVHTSHMKHPIIGDIRYGNPDLDEKLFSKNKKLKKRLYLHAASATFIHPEFERKVTFSAPIPEEFREFL